MNSSKRNKYLSWFFNFQNAPLMRCRHCHFPHGLGENIPLGEVKNLFLFLRSSLFPIGSLCKLTKFLIPIGPLF
jgi:hypothetical protein